MNRVYMWSRAITIASAQLGLGLGLDLSENSNRVSNLPGPRHGLGGQQVPGHV